MIGRTLKNAYWRWRTRRAPIGAGFDPHAYRCLHRDVAASGLDPTVHYVRFGIAEERDPSPDFSASGYRQLYPDLGWGTDPLRHWEETQAQPPLCLPEWRGEQTFEPGQKTVLVCGHKAGRTLYGAERSLLETLEGMASLSVNLVVILPGAQNHDYLERIRALCCYLFVIPMGWWRREHRPVPETINHLVKVLKRFQADLLYINTLVMDEPQRAARKLKVPVAVHVRELPSHDEALCRTLGANPDQVIEHLRNGADMVVANSSYTAESLGLTDAWLIPNGIDVPAFDKISSPYERQEPFTVGMISSNLPKKGLFDFVKLAQQLGHRTDIRFRLVGPENEWIRKLKNGWQGTLPDNLEFCGYTKTPQEAIELLDLVLNLSRFEESFGRSVLEAMAAGRPVIAYRWGALPELVEDTETGYLVPFGDIQAVEKVLLQLASTPSKRRSLGMSAHQKAARHYDKSIVQDRLSQFFEHAVNRRARSLGGS